MSLKVSLKAAAKEAIVRAASVLPGDASSTRCLMYHSVVQTEMQDDLQLTVSSDLVRRQFGYLRDNGYAVTDAAALVSAIRAGREPRARSVVLTFDDGYVDNRDVALPLLAEFGYRATLFVTADALTGRGRPEANRDYLTAAQARDMLTSGLISFGCHSASHRNLRGLGEAELAHETAGAKAQIEDALGVGVTLFAYPFGSYDAWDDRVRAAVQRAGYDGAFTSIVGPNTARRDPYLLFRSRISWAEEIPSFSRLLTGGYDWYARVQWLHARGGRSRRRVNAEGGTS